MAEVTGLRNNALPYPVYGLPWGVVFPMLDADGDLVTGATTPDAEVSKNGDTFADCSNESTEIATNSGVYYLLLTGTEMTADVVAVIAKSATAGMKTTVLTFYPRKLVTIRAGTSASGGVSTSTIVLDGSASAVDDFYNGMIVAAVIDSNVEVRMITDYTGSTQTATVTPDWNVAPDNNDTFTVYLPDGVQIQQANASHWNSLATVALPLAPTTAGRTLDVSAGGEAGVDWANVGSPTTAVDLSGTTIKTTQKVDVDTIKTNPVVNGGTVTFPTNATLASTTNITAGTVTTASAVTTVNGLAAGVITAASIAADAITAAKVAADVSAEIADAVWDEVLADHLTAGTTGNALNAAGSAGDPWATALPGAYGAGTAGRLIGRSLPDIVAGSAGGLMIAGSNAATTFATLTVTGAFLVSGGATYTSASGSGFTCSSSGGNGHGLLVTGNGSGHGVSTTGGATGHGLMTLGGATAGYGAYIASQASGEDGLRATGAGTGDGIHTQGGASGRGIHALGGATSGSGGKFEALAGNNNGLEITGFGSKSGMIVTGGATGHGIEVIGGGTSGDGINATVTSGVALRVATMTVTGALTAGTNAVPWNASWDAEVQSEVQDAIEANHLDHLLAVAAAGTEAANSSYWSRLVSKSATPAFSSYDNTTDSLEALRDRGDAAWATATGFSTHTAADVWSVVTRTITSLPTITSNWLTAAGLAADAALEIADAVLSRSVSNVEATAAEHSLCTIILAGLESSVSGTVWTINRTDGTTLYLTKAVTTNASADPITGVS